jgi:hypothetical protein
MVCKYIALCIDWYRDSGIAGKPRMRLIGDVENDEREPE